MPNDAPLSDDLLTFHDKEHTPAKIMDQIRQRLGERVLQPMPAIPRFGQPDRPLTTNAGIAKRLVQLQSTLNQIDTLPLLVPSPATQMPVIGRLWSFVREQAHQLPLFYVNRHLAHTTQITTQLIAVLEALAQQNIALQQEIAVLRAALEEHRKHEQ